MKFMSGRVAPVVAAAAVLVAGANVASYAANGHAFLLGKSNAESKTASLSNSGRGPALTLHSRSNSPALAVSNSKLVKKLNADKVDGKNAADLQTTTQTYRVPGGTAVPFTLELNGLQAGTYVASYNVVMNTGLTTPSRCFFSYGTTPPVATVGLGYGAVRNAFAVDSATTQLTLPAGLTLHLECTDATSVYNSTDTDFPSTVTLTRVAASAAGTTTATRNHAAKSGPAR
jgi:hypothetical protein